jgi:hypothetical protein
LVTCRAFLAVGGDAMLLLLGLFCLLCALFLFGVTLMAELDGETGARKMKHAGPHSVVHHHGTH